MQKYLGPERQKYIESERERGSRSKEALADIITGQGAAQSLRHQIQYRLGSNTIQALLKLNTECAQIQYKLRLRGPSIPNNVSLKNTLWAWTENTRLNWSQKKLGTYFLYCYNWPQKRMVGYTVCMTCNHREHTADFDHKTQRRPQYIFQIRVKEN